MKGHENAQPVKMIFLDTKEETIFKSVAYARRITGIVEYQIKQSLNPVNKKRFTYNNRIVVFRTIKP
jgi:hypothetical protein